MILSRLLTQRMVIFATLVLALVFAVVPMAIGMSQWRPEWALLVMLYWIIALPHRFNIGSAFIIGLIVDVLLGSTFGLHAGAYALVGYFGARHYQRIRNFSLIHQALFVMVLILVGRSVVFIGQHYLHNAPLMAEYFYPVISSGLIWPWVFLILRKIRRKFHMV